MPSTPRPDPARAAADLRLAARAEAAARSPFPRWFAPLRSVLFATGLALCAGPWTHRPAVLAAGLAVMLGFLLAHVAVLRRYGVAPRSAGTPAARLARQGLPAVAYAMGWCAALVEGAATGAVTAAVLAGIALWGTSVATATTPATDPR